MTLCTGLSQTPEMTMGAAPILDFRGLGQSRAWGHGELGPPQTCRVGGKRRLVQDGTGLRYLAVVSEYTR